MPVTLPASFKAEIERPWGSNPLLWLIEIEINKAADGPPVLPPVLFRMCNHHQELAWPASAPLGDTWYPFNFHFTPIEQTNEGDLPQMDLSVDNTTGLLMRYLHDGDGMEGNEVKIYLVPANGLAIAYPLHEYEVWETKIALSSANLESVTFRLEHSNYFEVKSPQDRYSAHRCRYDEFGGEECGYVRNEVAAYQTCPRTLPACVARGEDHRSRGLPVLHPRRFGAFPGIPAQQ